MGKGKPIKKTCTKCGKTKELRSGFREDRKNKRWPDVCRECEPKRGWAATEYIKSRQGMNTETVKCRGCGDSVTIQVEEGTKAPPIYCENCKTRETWHNSPLNDLVSYLRPIFDYTPIHGDVVIMKPGTPEFEAVASQCRPIKEVRRTGSMTFPGEASANRFIV